MVLQARTVDAQETSQCVWLCGGGLPAVRVGMGEVELEDTVTAALRQDSESACLIRVHDWRT